MPLHQETSHVLKGDGIIRINVDGCLCYTFFMKGRKKISILISSLIILVIGGFIAWSYVNKPSVGSITESTNSAAVTATATTKTTFAHINGKLISFDYPNFMKTQPNPKVPPSTLELYSFSHIDIQTWYLAIAVNKSTSGKVSDDSSYQYRKTKPDIYKESTVKIGKQEFVIDTDLSYGGFSKIAFMAHQGYVATVSLYGDDPKGSDVLQSDFIAILSSWQWK